MPWLRAWGLGQLYACAIPVDHTTQQSFERTHMCSREAAWVYQFGSSEIARYQPCECVAAFPVCLGRGERILYTQAASIAHVSPLKLCVVLSTGEDAAMVLSGLPAVDLTGLAGTGNRGGRPAPRWSTHRWLVPLQPRKLKPAHRNESSWELDPAAAVLHLELPKSHLIRPRVLQNALEAVGCRSIISSKL